MSWHKKIQFLSLLCVSMLLGRETTPPEEKKSQVSYKNVLSSISDDRSTITLDSGASFLLGWWYRPAPTEWNLGKELFFYLDLESSQFKIEDPDSATIYWSKILQFPDTPSQLLGLSTDETNPYPKLTTHDGFRFQSTQILFPKDWEKNDPLFILANSPELYQIVNLRSMKIITCAIAYNTLHTFQNIFSLEKRLNDKVLQQPQATKALAQALLIHHAGLQDPQKPLGVFLFLGPTGVGKTELAKTLAQELYDKPVPLLRFDMSHFSEYGAAYRLLGSPPGYQDSEEGGQLTNPLQANPQQIVLFDEIEKAHPETLQAFLPLFDEGQIRDAKNHVTPCSEAVFLLTSNLCSQEILQLSHAGYSSEEILEKIEPLLLRHLSLELYNRVQPVLFHPLTKETMRSLVDLLLQDIQKRIAAEKKVHVEFDTSVYEFLIEYGYSPTLGARPLKRLLEKEVLVALAHSISSRLYEEGEVLTVLYDPDPDKKNPSFSSDGIVLLSPKLRKPSKPKIRDIFSLEERLNAKVLQQPQATKALTQALWIYQAGLQDKQKPLGVFLFLGPTGVGKTELAKTLAQELYDDPIELLRLDMSHFTEEHALSRLIGSPPGYINNLDGGQLTNPLQHNPRQIVLLDEIEKAHPKIQKAFLPIFDEGRVMDANNNPTSCAEALFLLTSNLCNQEISELSRAGYSEEEILEAIEPLLLQHLSPEFYNRVRPIIFQPLAKETLYALVEHLLYDIQRDLENKGIQVHFHESLKKFLAENGYSPTLGARPLKRLIEQEVLVTLARCLLLQEYGDKITLFYDKASGSVRSRV